MVPTVPVAAMVLILGVDCFLAECRSLTNIIGNAVATLAVAVWEGELDRDRLAVISRSPGAVASAQTTPETSGMPAAKD